MIKPWLNASFQPYTAKHSFSELEKTHPFGNRTYEKRDALKKIANNETNRSDDDSEISNYLKFEDKRPYKYKDQSNKEKQIKNVVFVKKQQSQSQHNQLASYYNNSFIELLNKNKFTERVFFQAVCDLDLKKISDSDLISNDENTMDKCIKYGEFMKRVLERYKFMLAEFNRGRNLDFELELFKTRVKKFNLITNTYNMEPLQFRYQTFKDKFLDKFSEKKGELGELPACEHCQENAEILRDLMVNILKGKENFAFYLPFNHFCEKVVPISFLMLCGKLFNEECLKATRDSKILYRPESLPKISVLSLAGDGCEFNKDYLSVNMKNFQLFEFTLEEKNMFLKSSDQERPKDWRYNPEHWRDNQYLLFPLLPDSKNIQILEQELLEFFELKKLNSKEGISQSLQSKIISNNDLVEFFCKRIKSLLQDHSPDLVIFHLNVSILLKSENAVQVNLKPEGLAQIFREIAHVCNRKIIFVQTMDPIRYIDRKTSTIEHMDIDIEETCTNDHFLTEIIGSFVQAVQLWNIPNKVEKMTTLLDTADGVLSLWSAYYFCTSYLEKSRKTSIALKPDEYKLIFTQYLRKVDWFQKHSMNKDNIDNIFPKRKQLKEIVQRYLLNSIILIAKESDKSSPSSEKADFVKVFLKIDTADFYYSKNSVVHVHYFNVKSEQKALILFMNVNFQGIKNNVFVGLYTFSKSNECRVFEVGKFPGGHLTNFGLTSYEERDDRDKICSYTFAVYGGIPQEPEKLNQELSLYYLKFSLERIKFASDFKMDWEVKILKSDHGVIEDLSSYKRFDCSLIKFRNFLLAFGGNYLTNRKYTHCTEINYIDLKTHVIRRLNKISDCNFYPFKNPLLFNDNDKTIYMVGGYLNEMTVSNNVAFFEEWPALRSNILYDKPLFVYEFELKAEGNGLQLEKLITQEKFPKYKLCESLHVNWLTSDFFSKASSNMRKLEKKQNLSFRAVCTFFGKPKNLPWPILGGPDCLLRKKLLSTPHSYAVNNFCITMESTKNETPKSVEFDIINTTAPQNLMGYQFIKNICFSDWMNHKYTFMEEDASCWVIKNLKENNEKTQNIDNQQEHDKHCKKAEESQNNLAKQNCDNINFAKFQIKADSSKSSQETITPNIASHLSFLDSRERLYFLHHDNTKDLGSNNQRRYYDYYCYIFDLPDANLKGNDKILINVFYSFNFKDLFFEARGDDAVLKGASLFVNKDYFIICGGHNTSNLEEPVRGIAISMEYFKYCLETKQNVNPKSNYIKSFMPKQNMKRPLLVKIYKNLLMISQKVEYISGYFNPDEITLEFNLQIFPLFKMSSNSDPITANELEVISSFSLKELEQPVQSILEKLIKSRELKISSRYVRVFKDKFLKLNLPKEEAKYQVKGELVLEFGVSQKKGKPFEKFLGVISFDGEFTEDSCTGINFEKIKFIAKGCDFSYLVRNKKTFKLKEQKNNFPYAYDKQEKNIVYGYQPEAFQAKI